MRSPSPPSARRVERERRTVAAMVRIHCRGRHGANGSLCPDCSALLGYAEARASRCPWLPDKPSCRTCSIHCYRKEMREKIRAVMGYAGPRMALRHPWLALRHALDDRRAAPDRPPSRR